MVLNKFALESVDLADPRVFCWRLRTGMGLLWGTNKADANLGRVLVVDVISQPDLCFADVGDISPCDCQIT